MAAATMVCTAQTVHRDYRLDDPYLAYAIFVVALAMLGGSLLFAEFDAAMQRLA